MTKFLAILILTAAIPAFAADPAPAPDGPVAASLGDWRSAIGAIVRIYPCGNEICLRIVRLSPNPPETQDLHNPSASLVHRNLCNLDIGSGFTQSDAHHLGGGHLYDPISGRTYRGFITPTGPNTLRLRGYVLLTLFGRTETWTRVPTIAPCN